MITQICFFGQAKQTFKHLQTDYTKQRLKKLLVFSSKELAYLLMTVHTIEFRLFEYNELIVIWMKHLTIYRLYTLLKALLCYINRELKI